MIKLSENFGKVHKKQHMVLGRDPKSKAKAGGLLICRIFQGLFLKIKRCKILLLGKTDGYDENPRV